MSNGHFQELDLKICIITCRDVLTGPTERNPLVGVLLERQARWCYQHRLV